MESLHEFLHFHVLCSKQQMFNQVKLKMLVLTCLYFSVSAYIKCSDIFKPVFLFGKENKLKVLVF